MKAHRWAAVLIALVICGPNQAEEKKNDGFVPLFNGKDLTGWVNVNCAPGTFFVKGNEIITTGKPTGFLRTAKQYENFIAEFEWMHVNKKEVGNSGFFVWADPLPATGTPYTRGIEVQVLVNLEKKGYYTSQGDLFSIHGATCKPDRPHPHGWARCLPREHRCKGGGEWNHYKVIGNNGVLKLHVNGKEVSGLSQCNPRKGYLALESEGAECHFRNLKIKELPSTRPKPEETAHVAKDFKNLFTGLDLSGWQVDPDFKKHWQPNDWVLHYDGKGDRKKAALRTSKKCGDREVIVDFRFVPKKNAAAPCQFILWEGKDGMISLMVSPKKKVEVITKNFQSKVEGGEEGNGKGLKPVGQWNRLHAIVKEGMLHITINGELVRKSVNPLIGKDGGRIGLIPGGAMDFGNLFVRELAK